MKRYNIAIYQCQNCNHILEAPALSDFSYGEFILSSISGEYRYLNAIEDSIYKEVSDMISKQEKELQVDIQNIFGPLACDTDKNGHSFHIGVYHCPNCKSRRFKVLNINFDDFTVVLPVTHNQWEKLNNKQKETAYLGLVLS